MTGQEAARAWARRFWLLAVFSLLGEVPLAAAQTAESITCPDGTVRIVIELKAIAIQYEAASFAATLGSLTVLGARLTVEPKTL